ncbi:MAG: Eco57I restriction-modification methylase domain-containing protein [Kiritimatiellae bacterium]|nr:Eco57I restriction-modification methylase domain-containing protein [Kiritimatiellia bacterium]
MDKNEFLGFLHDADFGGLFIECGWSSPTSKTPFEIACGETTYAFSEAAHQKGFRVLVCRTPHIPDSSVRRTLDAKIRKRFDACLMVFVSTSAAFRHLWSVPVKAVDRRQLVTVEYEKDDQAVFLLEKIHAISFSYSEEPTIIDVVDRVNKAFLVNAAEVTKKFYQGFRKEHDKFVKGILNLADGKDREWYASVMLNRLMFCYFIQKKGFLDGNENYLGDKLKWVKKTRGENKFNSFYRSFLMHLFMDGLDSPAAKRSASFLKTYGRIPYLNGGMFAEHSIEKENRNIDIPDKVFESVFAFFDQWRWHLDTRITATGRDINPDVLGYIFEQYINDRAQMGAYYTKEDITEYIGRNCIVPWLLKEALGGGRDSSDRRDARGSQSLTSLRSPVSLLQSNPDRYIFPAVRKGVDLPLPPKIEKGVAVEPQRTLRSRRAGWNAPAGEEYALPTEIWRETVARRQRCEELRRKIAAGEIADVNDFITYNLDIRTFAEDVIRKTDNHLLVRRFYAALRKVTVLDPTCGSGAFLFAALNILEPLYEACLDRMEEFHEKNSKLFKEELAEIVGKFRSNRQYFICKNIILRNLYGVDIMHEATEIAKLRLFLKLVAVVDVDHYDANLGLDPLPDVDFNIRCGNTLVGFANPQGVKDAILPPEELALDQSAYDKVERKAADVADLYEIFKREQQNAEGSAAYYAAKNQLKERLSALNAELDRAMAYRVYGINPDTVRGKKEFQEWKRKSQPFHWYSEFYGITVGNGGFDIIIGNPPYVEYSKVEDYKIKGYKTELCGNLYAYVVERAEALINNEGRRGMIIPHSSICTDRMETLFDIFVSERGWFSTYDTRPAKLFEGVDQRLLIYILGGKQLFTSKYHRWNEESRAFLFETIRYTKGIVPDCVSLGKFGADIEHSIYSKVCACPRLASYQMGDKYTLYYHNAPRYFIRFSDKPPYFYSDKQGETISVQVKKLCVSKNCNVIAAAYNSALFYWWFVAFSDCRHLLLREINSFHIPAITIPVAVVKRLFADYARNAKRKETFYKSTGRVVYDEFYPKLSKPIIDEIDELLAKHYGFTEEELDFIINYDIKYRMGDKLNGEE